MTTYESRIRPYRFRAKDIFYFLSDLYCLAKAATFLNEPLFRISVNLISDKAKNSCSKKDLFVKFSACGGIVRTGSNLQVLTAYFPVLA